MQQWWLLGIRSLWDKPGRTGGACLAVALGVAIVVWISCAYESFMVGLDEQVRGWIGRSHVTVEPPLLGVIEESFVERLRAVDNVKFVAPRAKSVALITLPETSEDLSNPETRRVDLIGIDPRTEYHFRTFRGSRGPLGHDPDAVDGRLLATTDAGGCMIEDAMASKLGLAVGDRVRVSSAPDAPVAEVRIIGRYQRRRVAQFQRHSMVMLLPEVQRICHLRDRVTVIDLILKDDSLAALRRTADAVTELASEGLWHYPVSTAEARMRQLNSARELTQFILGFLSGAALLTSLFIVVSTLSMGMVERLTQMGMMRCVGMTRLQLGFSTLCEVLPIGVIGIVVGIPLGLCLTWVSVAQLPEYLQELVVSRWGLWIAVIGGLLTTVFSGLLPAVQASMISPLAATCPQTGRPRDSLLLLSSAAGVLLIAAHEAAILVLPSHLWFHKTAYTFGTLSLYGGYALLTAAAARWVSGLLSGAAARLLRFRRPLLHDNIAGTPWRSATICTGFMVALSLVVTIAVHTGSVMAGWDFPTRIPEGFVWMFRPIPHREVQRVRSMAGTRDVVAVTNFLCRVDSPGKSGVAIARFPATMFVAVDAPQFLELTKLEYLEGDPEQAVERMIRGGSFLVPQDAANVLNLHVGDRVPVIYGPRSCTLEVAGVVKSPALDIAAALFEAESQLMQAAGSSIIGSLEDAQTCFNVHHVSLLLVNLQVTAVPDAAPEPRFFRLQQPPERITHQRMAELLFEWQNLMPQHGGVIASLREPVAAWTQQVDTWAAGERVGPAPPPPATLRPFTHAMRLVIRFFWHESTPQQRWQHYQEQVVLHHIKYAVGRPTAITGSIRRMKDMIDREVDRTMRLITTMPLIGLFVAALGAGNLMMSNVALRRRSIAVLRCVGAGRWLIMRVVLAEALILGLLGTAFGLAVGLHSAHSINRATFLVWGYETVWTVPWDVVSLGIGLTMGCCLFAGLLPARDAARGNIIAAMAAP